MVRPSKKVLVEIIVVVASLFLVGGIIYASNSVNFNIDNFKDAEISEAGYAYGSVEVKDQLIPIDHGYSMSFGAIEEDIWSRFEVNITLVNQTALNYGAHIYILTEDEFEKYVNDQSFRYYYRSLNALHVNATLLSFRYVDYKLVIYNPNNDSDLMISASVRMLPHFFPHFEEVQLKSLLDVNTLNATTVSFTPHPNYNMSLKVHLDGGLFSAMILDYDNYWAKREGGSYIYEAFQENVQEITWNFGNVSTDYFYLLLNLTSGINLTLALEMQYETNFPLQNMTFFNLEIIILLVLFMIYLVVAIYRRQPFKLQVFFMLFFAAGIVTDIFLWMNTIWADNWYANIFLGESANVAWIFTLLLMHCIGLVAGYVLFLESNLDEIVHKKEVTFLEFFGGMVSYWVIYFLFFTSIPMGRSYFEWLVFQFGFFQIQLFMKLIGGYIAVDSIFSLFKIFGKEKTENPPSSEDKKGGTTRKVGKSVFTFILGVGSIYFNLEDLFKRDNGLVPNINLFVEGNLLTLSTIIDTILFVLFLLKYYLKRYPSEIGKAYEQKYTYTPEKAKKLGYITAILQMILFAVFYFVMNLVEDNTYTSFTLYNLEFPALILGPIFFLIGLLIYLPTKAHNRLLAKS